ncbi:hypothetical protein [Flavobacterium sp. C4GT6]|uniref:hypothetical protein n=1 Tax=Flavobacterium sp. C4GT6 TaxID=3103818 RepID=UPI002ED33E61
MSKLNFDTLKERAKGVASSELLETISGGVNNDCHDNAVMNHVEHVQNQPRPGYTPLGEAILRWLFDD